MLPFNAQEIEHEVRIFCMDLRTLTFYTDFLFTKESREFKYSMRREPNIAERIVPNESSS